MIALVFAAGAALTQGGIGLRIERAIARGLCAVTERSCSRLLAESIPPDLEPCPMARSESTEEASLDIGVVRLAARLGLGVERRSDGAVSVSFADTATAGAALGVGAHLQLGKVGANAEAEIAAGFAITSGRVWRFRTPSDAQRFIASYAESQRLSGRMRAELKRVCEVCAALAGAPSRPPAADERWLSGGPVVGAKLGVAAGPSTAQVDSFLKGAIGRRISATGTTWFMRIDARAQGQFDAFGKGADGQAETRALAALGVDRQGRPRTLRIVVERRMSSRSRDRTPSRLRALLGVDSAGNGDVFESESLFKLRNQDNVDAAARFLSATRSFDAAAVWAEAERLKNALASNGVQTVRHWRLSSSGTAVGMGAALGVRLGADAQARDDRQVLVGVASKLPSLGWLPRADCLAV
jgi:hypothetical protein